MLQMFHLKIIFDQKKISQPSVFLCTLIINSIYFQFQMSIEDFQPLKTLFLEKVGHGWKATSAGDVLIATRLFKLEKVTIGATFFEDIFATFTTSPTVSDFFRTFCW